MCYSIIEIYSFCRCIYYQHALDKCAEYGKTYHQITRKVIEVGYACADHDRSGYGSGVNNNASDSVAIPAVSPAKPVQVDGDAYPSNRRGRRLKVRREPGPAQDQEQRARTEHNRAGNELWAQLNNQSERLLNALPDDDPDPAPETASEPYAASFRNGSSSCFRLDVKESKLGVIIVQHGNIRDLKGDAEKLLREREELVKGFQNPGGDSGSPTITGENPSSNVLAESHLNTRGYDSDDSELSDTGSVMSTISATSSATTVDIDPIEDVFHRLLLFQDLRFLWPQLVRRSRSRRACLRIIERFLRRYAEDLAKLAVKPQPQAQAEKGFGDPARQVQIMIAASRFVRRSRLNLAQRIFEAHHVTEYVAVGEKAVMEDDAKAGVDMMDDESDGDSPLSFTYLVAEAFLFETDPILYLQANVKAFVKIPPQHPKGLMETVNMSCRRWLDNVFLGLGRRPVAEGKKRITWECKCGRQLYDDFVELREGASKELETQLRLQNTEEMVPVAIHDENDDELPHNEKAGGMNFTSAVSQVWQGIQSLPRMLASTKGILPRHRQTHSRTTPDSELGLCPSAGSSNTASRFHNFVLLCVPFQRWAARLHQAEVCRINSDQDFFRVMRHCYSLQRGRSAWTRFRMVRGIEFVKFEVYRSQLIDVQFRPSIPPDGTPASEYAYEPLPAEIMPPIGSNHLMHLFEHPEDAEITPVLYRRIPKKLRAKLEACPTKGSSVGWGLQFVEGMNWVVLFVYGCVGFGLSLLAAVMWATVRADVQGAFAIAGFMIAFMLFCAGIARSEIHG